MNIYYRREKTWCKYPWQDMVDTDFVKFSMSKRKFHKSIFLEIDPKHTMEERKQLVADELKVKPTKINLIKY